MNPSSRVLRLTYIVSLSFVVGYLGILLCVPAGAARTTANNLLLCVMPLLVNGELLLNAVTPNWRTKAFWMLLALGSSLWLAGQAILTYMEVYQRRRVAGPFTGDIIFFLHTVPMIAALTMQPHKPADDRKMQYARVDFAVVLCWWVYLYIFLTVPWQSIAPNDGRYFESYIAISAFQSAVYIAGAVALALHCEGYWRRIYLHLAGAGTLYLVGFLSVKLVAGRNAYSSGGVYLLPVVLSFLWLGMTGVFAWEMGGRKEEKLSLQPAATSAGDGRWASHIARLALLSVPLIGFWCVRVSQAPMAVHEFRTLTTLAAVLPLAALAFLRHALVDADRMRLLRASQESLDNLKRLQMQVVQSEKLASIGQLVAGAAHELNNPLTAILGYSELLADDPTAEEKTRSLGAKIREQARRTKTVVNNLLTFARQGWSEQRSPVDVNAIVNSSVQFRRFDLRGKNIRIEVQAGTALPQVLADVNQLLQVFTNIINNAVDAMRESGGGALIIKTLVERGSVVILFSDTGPGLRDPQLVFDPFYTTKPAGQGTGLGLSICYGLVQDQGGRITCHNRPEGGATFRVELPALPGAFPLPPKAVSPGAREIPAKLA